MTKTALVTGATGSIGSHIAIELSREEDWRVIGTYRDHERVKQVVDKAPQIEWVPFNIGYGQDTIQICKFQQLAKQLDMIVIAHGHRPLVNAFKNTRWHAVFDLIKTDLLSTMHMIQEFIPILTPGNATIAIISSIHGVSSYPYRVPYGVAKTALVGFARSLSLELAGEGININAICPGQVEGPRTQSIGGDDTVQKMLKRSPSGKFVSMGDIFRTILWTYATKSITGQAIVLDHGVTSSSYYDDFNN